MATFRKKPVEIEAVRTSDVLRAAKDNWSDLPDVISSAYEAGNILFLSDSVEIKTLEGVMTASGDDWILIGVSGEIYPCKDSIFRQTYEPVTIEATSLFNE